MRETQRKQFQKGRIKDRPTIRKKIQSIVKQPPIMNTTLDMDLHFVLTGLNKMVQPDPECAGLGSHRILKLKSVLMEYFPEYFKPDR